MYANNRKSMIYDEKKPLIMGVLNITDDSFFDKSRILSKTMLFDKIHEMRSVGVSILDIGACSTRPNSSPVSLEEELRRLESVMPFLREEFPDILVSVDTFRSEVARIAIEDWGVNWINDVYAGDLDPNMFKVVSELKVPYILTHHLKSNLVGIDLVNEIFAFFVSKLEQLRSCGVEEVVLDVGFGFGKDLTQNFQILHFLEEFKKLNCPLLVGLSRKTMVWQTLGITPNEALNGTTVLNTIALLNGANILRVHDVAEARQVVDLVYEYNEANNISL